MATCLICGDHPLDSELLDHIRHVHPDVDADPERWPDGAWAVTDTTLQPNDFQE